MKRIINVIKQLTIKDFLSPFVFLIILIPSFIFRLINKVIHRKLWLVSEEGEARDNGYYFYKYMKEKHPNDYCFYAVKPKSAGYKKVLKLGNVINFGSLKHWLYYMSADLNISSQTAGNPSNFFWYFLHVPLGLYKNRVFLQHGVTFNDALPLYYHRTKFKYFMTTNIMEHNEILKKFGYPKGAVVLSGFPRWDYLKNKKSKEKSILIMPTWRKYLGVQNSALFSSENDFLETDYFKAWNNLLNDKTFIGFIEKNDIKVYFYPHQNMQKMLHFFYSSSNNVRFVSMDENISEYISKCSLMITDYSSVMFDFAYLGKSVIYYQFDQKDFKNMHHGEGYFNYRRDAFGPVTTTKSGLLKWVTKYFKNDFPIRYCQNIERFFTLTDTNNSFRVYNALNNNILPVEYFLEKKKMPKITIVVPAYNAQFCIAKSLNSLLMQPYTNIEVIVVDDGSDDLTVKKVSEYVRNDKRIFLIKQVHKGPNFARGKGVQKASGDYVMFVDADDYVREDAILKLVDCIKRKSPDIIRFGAVYQRNGVEVCPISENIDRDGFIEHRKVMELLFNTNKLNSLCFQAYKTKILKEDKKIFNDSVVFGEDFLLNLKLHNEKRKMVIMKDILYVYCDTINSTTNSLKYDQIIANIKNRIFVSTNAIKKSIIYYGDNKDAISKIVYAQTEMVLYAILKLAQCDKIDKKKVLCDINIALSEFSVDGIDLMKILERSLSKMGFFKKIEEGKVLRSILCSDCEYIWKYICIYRLYRIVFRRRIKK